MTTPTYLAIDIETTGLDPQTNRILEVAAFVLDADFNVLDDYYARIGASAAQLANMDAVVLEMHLGTGLVARDRSGDLYVVSPTATMTEVVLRLTAMCDAQADRLQLLGCGVHFERAWLEFWAPSCAKRLHYRTVDSRTLQTVGQDLAQWPGEDIYPKHTAMGDVMRSIAVCRKARELLKLGASSYDSVSALEAELQSVRRSIVECNGALEQSQARLHTAAVMLNHERAARHTLRAKVLYDISVERERQDEKHGKDRDLPLLDPRIWRDGLDPCTAYGLPSEAQAKAMCDNADREGRSNIVSILLEELCEAVNAGNPQHARDELVQIAATAVQAIENIDRKRDALQQTELPQAGIIATRMAHETVLALDKMIAQVITRPPTAPTQHVHDEIMVHYLLCAACGKPSAELPLEGPVDPYDDPALGSCPRKCSDCR